MTESVGSWVDGLTIGDMLRRAAQRHLDRDALVFPDLDQDGIPRPSADGSTSTAAGRNCYRRTFRQLDAEVDRVARSLLALGIERGEHVAVWATNWPQWVLLQYGTARVGAVQVNINPAYRASELAYVLKQSDSAALFLIDSFRDADYFGMLAAAVPEVAESRTHGIESSEFPRLRHVVSLKSARFESIRGWSEFLQLGDSVPPDRLAERESQLRPEDAVNIQYTSGTTGFPKGATLTHRNLLINALLCGQCQRFTELDRLCVPVPFYHCFGCVMGVLCTAIFGAALVVPAEYFDAGRTLSAIEAEAATSVYGVPTMFIAMLGHPTFPARNLKSLRTGIMAGSPCPVELMKRVVDEMGAREITIAYGLTEASPIVTQTRTEDPLDLRVHTVGRPIPGVEVKVIDPATGATLGDEQQGELCTRGHNVMLGYYNMPEQTDQAIDRDGWLHTGDVCLRLPNGYYRITGRIKDMICRGGENIYPREIEEFLYTHPAVQDVAVVGVPDPKFIEEVAACIRLKPGSAATEDEIREFCLAQLARYKVPRHIRFVTEFPQTVTGKIQKFKLREMLSAELRLAQPETA